MGETGGEVAVLMLTLRDLQYRKRQFAIAIIGAGLTFALALVLTGVRNGFDVEAADTIDSAKADGWVVQKGTPGPFTSVSGLPAATAQQIASAKGVDQVASFIALPNTLERDDGELIPVNVNGVEPGKVGAPAVDDGEPLKRPGQVVVGSGAEVSPGDKITLSGREFEVAGTIEDRTYFGGQPVAYITVADARELAFAGQQLSSAILFTGSLAKAPEGLEVLSNGDVEADMKRVLKGAIDAIDLVRILMWIVAAVIIGAVIYLSALERLNDFAVMKAVGSESRSLAIGVSMQAVIASLAAAALAVGLAQVLKPAFALPVAIDSSAYISLVVVAVVVGVISSLAALRRVLKVDPALAFG